MAVATAWVLVATGAAWLLLIAVRGLEPSFGDPPLYIAATETACVTLTVAGIEMALFAMLPLRFLPGDAVLRWNKLVWVALVAFGVFGFFLVLVNPQNGYLGDSSRNSLFTMVLLLAVFGVSSVLFWAYFRFRAAAGRRGAAERGGPSLEPAAHREAGQGEHGGGAIGYPPAVDVAVDSGGRPTGRCRSPDQEVGDGLAAGSSKRIDARISSTSARVASDVPGRYCTPMT